MRPYNVLRETVRSESDRKRIDIERKSTKIGTISSLWSDRSRLKKIADFRT
jgi:hypothetical protein